MNNKYLVPGVGSLSKNSANAPFIVAQGLCTLRHVINTLILATGCGDPVAPLDYVFFLQLSDTLRRPDTTMMSCSAFN